MPAWFTSFESTLKTAVQAMWPEITDNKLFMAYQAQPSKILDIAEGVLEDDTGSPIGAPYCMIQTGRAIPDREFGFGRLFRVHTTIWYVDRMENRGGGLDQQAYIDAKLQLLNDYIYTNVFSAGFVVIEMGETDSSESNEANVLFIDAGYPLYGGCIDWIPGLQSGDGLPG